MENEELIKRIEALEALPVKVSWLIKKAIEAEKFVKGDRVKCAGADAIWEIVPYGGIVESTGFEDIEYISRIKFSYGFPYREYHLRLVDDYSVERYRSEISLELAKKLDNEQTDSVQD